MIVFYVTVAIGAFWYAVENVFSEGSKASRIGTSFIAALLWPVILGRKLAIWLDEDDN